MPNPSVPINNIRKESDPYMRCGYEKPRGDRVLYDSNHRKRSAHQKKNNQHLTQENLSCDPWSIANAECVNENRTPSFPTSCRTG